MQATYAESLRAASGDKVRAIRMYRERTKRSLYEAKIAVEEGARLIEREEAKKILNNPNTVSEVTSCG
jgi:ribosomal protein L7/L12